MHVYVRTLFNYEAKNSVFSTSRSVAAPGVCLFLLGHKGGSLRSRCPTSIHTVRANRILRICTKTRDGKRSSQEWRVPVADHRPPALDPPDLPRHGCNSD